MSAEYFFRSLIPTIMGQKEKYPFMDKKMNLYKGDFSLILKAIDIAYKSGYDQGCMNTEELILNQTLRKN